MLDKFLCYIEHEYFPGRLRDFKRDGTNFICLRCGERLKKWPPERSKMRKSLLKKEEEKPMDRKAITSFIENFYPDYIDKILLADGFDAAFIGIGNSYTKEPCAVYDRGRCIEILEQDMDNDSAEEFFSFNTEGAYVGEFTPIFIETIR